MTAAPGIRRRTHGLRTAAEIRRAAREAEGALPPLTPAQARRIAAAAVPAFAELRRRRQEQDGVA